MKKMFKDNLWKIIVSSLVTLLPSVITLILWDSLNGSTGPASTEVLKGVLMWFALYLPLIMAALNIGVILVTFWDNAKREQSSKVISMIYWMIPAISLYSYFVCISIILGTQIEIMNLTLILFEFIHTLVLAISIPFSCLISENVTLLTFSKFVAS